MVQQGQTIELTRRGPGGERLWAYRFRTGGRDSKRIQRGGFASEQDARDALGRELERLRRERSIARRLTLAELVETYLAQHDVQPVTIEKLRYLLGKATAVFGDRRIGELTSQEIAEWRMTLSPGYRFEATQALRQVLHRAVAWGMIDLNPAKVGVENPVRRRKEQHPFESWAELEALAAAIGPRYGPMILFAAATGLRPAEWIALEKRDIDRKERVVYVRRAFTRGELKIPKTEASMRAVPLQTRALDALDRVKDGYGSPLQFPGDRGGYLDIHHFRPFQWRPAQKAADINPIRRVYDLRHTFATFALRAGISTFDLSRYMGASLTMIDRHYGHLARDGREHAIKLLDALDAGWKPSDGLEPSTPSLPSRADARSGNAPGSLDASMKAERSRECDGIRGAVRPDGEGVRINRSA